MFVPRGWAHAVLNLRPSVGLAVEMLEPPPPPPPPQVVHFEHFHRRVHDAFGALDALAPKSTAGAACAAEPAWIPSSTAVFSAGAALGTSDDENEGPIPRFY